MYNKKFFQTFLQKNGVKAQYQIWVTTPEDQQYILLDGSQTSNVTEQVDASKRQVTVGHSTHFNFSFPKDYHIRVVIFQKVKFTEDNLEIMHHLLYPIYAERSLKASNNKISKIIDSIRHTTSSFDIEDLFSKILTNTLEVIPNADLGHLWIYDSDIDRLVCKASVGNLLKGIRNMQFRIGEGPIGYTFKMGTPRLFQNISELSEYNDISPENTKYWDSSYDLINNVKSMISVPIVIGETTECVMILCQIKRKHALTEEDLHLLEGFTSQLGIALKNARLFTDVKKQNDLLLKREDIHSTLTNLSLQNKGANRIIRELNRMIGQRLLFIDLIENESIPEIKYLPTNQSFKELVDFLTPITQETYYDVLNSGELTHYVYPIRSGNVILGCIMIEIKHPLTPLDHIALEQAESILALELVKKHHLVEFYYKKQRDLFNELLTTKDQEILLQKGRQLGVDNNAEFVSVIFQFSNYSDEQALEMQVHRFIALLKKDFSPYIQIIFGYHNNITMLAQLPGAPHLPIFEEGLKRMLDNWLSNTKEYTLCGGIGSVYRGLGQISKTYHEAKIALSYLVTRKRTGLVQYSEVGVNRLFMNQNIEEIKRFLEEVFGPLRTPHQLNNALEQTLISYFENNRLAAKTAKVLHIHINTLYQRLKKIEESLEISFDNPDDALKLQLACYLKATFE